MLIRAGTGRGGETKTEGTTRDSDATSYLVTFKVKPQVSINTRTRPSCIKLVPIIA
jgi:hypothetical protein